MNDTGISPQVLAELCDLAGKHGLCQVILFGSRARGDYRPTSDIDLAVRGGSAPAFALDADEDTWTLLKFDIVDLDGTVQPELLDSIEREGVVLYEKV